MNVWDGIGERVSERFTLCDNGYIISLFDFAAIKHKEKYSELRFYELESVKDAPQSKTLIDSHEFMTSIGLVHLQDFDTLKRINIVFDKIFENKRSNQMYFVNDNSFCSVSIGKTKIIDVVVFSFNNEIIEKVKDWVIANFKKKNYSDELHVVTTGRDGLSTTTIETPSVKLVKENYSKSVIKDWESISKNIKAKIPVGRLNILRGAPGCGKTFLLKSLIGIHDNATYINIMPDVFTRVSSPEIVKMMLQLEYDLKSVIIVFIEDGDSLLVSRKAGKNDEDVVSKLLNMTDGFLSDTLNMHFVITTNLEKVDIDEALSRKGRIHKIIELEELSASEANLAYSKMKFPEKDEDFNFIEPTVLADVYARARGLVEPVKKKPTIGFGR